MKTHLSVRAWMLCLLDLKLVITQYLQTCHPSTGVAGLVVDCTPYVKASASQTLRWQLATFAPQTL